MGFLLLYKTWWFYKNEEHNVVRLKYPPHTSHSSLPSLPSLVASCSTILDPYDEISEVLHSSGKTCWCICYGELLSTNNLSLMTSWSDLYVLSDLEMNTPLLLIISPQSLYSPLVNLQLSLKGENNRILLLPSPFCCPGVVERCNALDVIVIP